MYTVFASDAESNLAQTISSVTRQERNVKIMAQMCDGAAVVACIERIRPEIIFLDSALLGKGDGDVKEHINNTMPGYEPILCYVGQESCQKITRLLLSLETDFLSICPAAAGENEDEAKYIVKSRALQGSKYDAMTPKWTYPEERASVSDAEINDLLVALGAPPQLRSTKTVCTAISLCVKDPSNVHFITKNLYPTVAETEKLERASVERRIRYCIGLMQAERSPLFSQIFSHAGKRNITCGEFISTITNYLLRVR